MQSVNSAMVGNILRSVTVRNTVTLSHWQPSHCCSKNLVSSLYSRRHSRWIGCMNVWALPSPLSTTVVGSSLLRRVVNLRFDKGGLEGSSGGAGGATATSWTLVRRGDDVDDVDEDFEEALAAMTSGLTDNLPVASNLVCVGIDPDLSGAIAVLKSHDNCTIAEVFDVPCITVPVNKKMRRRHDYQSIAAIVKQLQAPQGSIAYLEQAMPFPTDGKQGWYITGYGYRVWIGILAAAGFTVIPVQPRVWKTAMGICGKDFTKDDSRTLASSMFPIMSTQLRRKKDHGRAEALLIAAFGKGMTLTNVASLDKPHSPNRIESPNQPA